MLARIRKSMEEKDQGFTLIELLVVIIIIGILAAIAIPTFLNQREKGWVGQVESSVKNATTAAESYAVDENGSYDGLTGAELTAEGYNPTAGVTVAVAETDLAYTLTGTHANLPGRTFTYDSSTGVIVDSENP